jgi:trigger factor
LALVEGCKHSLEITIPVEAVDAATLKVTGDYQKMAKLPGFRPGKAPASMIRKHFEGDIRQKVLETLVPKFFDSTVQEEKLQVISQPDIKAVHFHAGEPVKFTAEFEVAPEVELGEYKGLEVAFSEPEVSGEDVEKRISEIRNEKATFVNLDARKLADGDFAVVSLESIDGIEPPLKQDELNIEVGGKDTLEGFTENLRGMEPDEEKVFEVTYPEDSGQANLAGKTVKFYCTVKGLRKKELPDATDEFAQDLGDYRNMEEFRDAVKKSLAAQRHGAAVQEAKNKLVDVLVDKHEFPVPQIFVERQIDNRLEQMARSLVDQGIDVSKLQVDWEKLREAQKDKAVREVRASLLLSKVSEKESIHATNAEVDREVERLARQQRQPVVALRPKLEKDGTLGRIASHIQTEKTLAFLFDNANKVAAA